MYREGFLYIYGALQNGGDGSFYTYGVALMYTYRDGAWEGSPSSYIGVGSVGIVENV